MGRDCVYGSVLISSGARKVIKVDWLDLFKIVSSLQSEKFTTNTIKALNPLIRWTFFLRTLKLY